MLSPKVPSWSCWPRKRNPRYEVRAEDGKGQALLSFKWFFGRPLPRQQRQHPHGGSVGDDLCPFHRLVLQPSFQFFARIDADVCHLGPRVPRQRCGVCRCNASGKCGVGFERKHPTRSASLRSQSRASPPGGGGKQCCSKKTYPRGSTRIYFDCTVSHVDDGRPPKPPVRTRCGAAGSRCRTCERPAGRTSRPFNGQALREPRAERPQGHGRPRSPKRDIRWMSQKIPLEASAGCPAVHICSFSALNHGRNPSRERIGVAIVS